MSRREADRAYVAEHAKRGKFEMAMGSPDRYETVKCYLVGPIAVHRDFDDEWRMSIAAVGLGLPCAFGRTLREAVMVARAVARAIDWSTIERNPKKIGAPIGMTTAKRQAVGAMLQSFSFIDERRWASCEKQGLK